MYTQKWDCWIIWHFYFYFLKKRPYCIPQLLCQFTFSPTACNCSLFSPSLQHLFLVLLKIAILTGVRWYFIMVLIRNSLMTSLSKHFFAYLLIIWMSSLGKCLLRYFHYFKIGLLGVFFLSFFLSFFFFFAIKSY